ncbi:thioredoxin-like protein [Trematosphaeria pertusa]|uniref:Thioredoxin-like protein n=1 Tax=Trematosphaeria pertusa TaxID=390896 RepID=A0A6A6I7Z3_9PLEO|nr:thioredoxin-like protein [Trematosphaeria pertusa]KAF2246665.1 thioredoxin-like protein [Trematosphaeria pertusa]
MAHTTFPSDLPVPPDDGACAHLPGSQLPSILLPATSGERVDLSTLRGLTILFCYPRTGAPNETTPAEWNAIPGARGCTPQSCGFRDEMAKLRQLGVAHLFGLSTQDTPYQQEAKERLHLPYDLLSDEKLEFTKALKLPTFDWKSSSLVKRLALAVVDGKITRVWYPVFPPDRNAEDVVAWLESR